MEQLLRTKYEEGLNLIILSFTEKNIYLCRGFPIKKKA